MKLCEACGARYRGTPTTCPLDGSPLADLPDPLVGRTIGGRYLVQERIGAGGMGTVYRARHEILERDVALKFLAPELAFDEQSRARFLREARAANRINHEHIIHITDYGETDDGLVYLVMELLDGTPLDALVRRGSLPTDRALRIAMQVAWALGRAHELDVIHRDIKPENIYLIESHGGDFVKVLDFGLAHVKGELRLTASGTVFGTPEYMAPEQARGMRATPATDLYALGCVLFEMLTGRLPFEGGTSLLILKHMREAPPAPSSIKPALTPQIDALVAQLLAKEPSDRPTNAYQVAERIGALVNQQTGLTNPPQPPQTQSDDGHPPRLSGMRVQGRSISVDDLWVRRVEVFRTALARAHGSTPPEWLAAAVASLEARAAEVNRLRAERDARLSEVSQREEELHATRMRIGRALDELARDEAQVAAAMEESEAAAAEARTALDGIEDELRRRWASLGPPPEASPLPRAGVEAVAAMGHLANRWTDAKAVAERLDPVLEPWRRQRDDLRFQITQLKGRLGSVGADLGYDLDEGKAEAEALDRHAREELEALVREAEPVMRHFLAIPELRPLLLAAPAGGPQGSVAT